MNTRSRKRSTEGGLPPVSPKPRKPPTVSTQNTEQEYSSDSTRDEDDESVTSLVGSIAASALASPSSSKGGRPHGTKNRSRSNIRGLADWEQKIVASDAEEFGGLAKINERGVFRTFCEAHEDTDEERARIYGSLGSKERDRVRHKLEFWRKIGSEEYLGLLSDWNILPATFREAKQTEEQPPSSRKQTPKKHSSKKKKQTPPTKKQVQAPSVVTTSTTAVDDLSFGLESLSISSNEQKRLPPTMSDLKQCK